MQNILQGNIMVTSNQNNQYNNITDDDRAKVEEAFYVKNVEI